MSIQIKEIIEECEGQISKIFKKTERNAYYSQQKVLDAMQKNRLAERHFVKSTGYGYNDDGRDVCEKIYADVMGAQRAIVRPQIVSGTHAISLCLYSLLRPGDNFLSITSRPYDTIYANIKSTDKNGLYGTLDEFDISYREMDYDFENSTNIDNLRSLIDERTKVVFMQRSTGYSTRKALSIEKIKKAINVVRNIKKDIIIVVDNCYGEFIETKEPCEVGADIIAGSLIKNPGGGLAQTGGYIAGKDKYVTAAAARLTAPSIAFEVGANMDMIRSYLQGLFIAPSVVAGALKGAILTSKVMEEMGFKVFPRYDDERSDIIQAIELGNREKVVKYCKAIQSCSPVDSFVDPEPWDMPGYDEEIVMAAGNFIQGSSIELSADSPMREPYIVYQQGGLTYEHVKIALNKAASSIK